MAAARHAFAAVPHRPGSQALAHAVAALRLRGLGVRCATFRAATRSQRRVAVLLAVGAVSWTLHRSGAVWVRPVERPLPWWVGLLARLRTFVAGGVRR